MINLELLNKIKAEIKRLKNENAEWRERINSEDGYSYESDVCCGYDEAIEDFETFINSLSEEKPSKDLEGAAEELFETIEIQEHENIFEDTFKKIFIAGAEWQKQQNFIEWNEDAELYFNNWIQHNDATQYECFEEGRKYAQMQKLVEWNEDDLNE